MKIYLKTINKWLEVTKEEHDTYYRKINSYRKTQQNHGRCTLSHQMYYMCDMDCCACAYSRAGDTLSLDSTIDDKAGNETYWSDLIQDTTIDINSYVETKIDLNELINLVNELMPEAKRIGEMRLSGMTDKQIAEDLGIARTTMLSRIDKVKKTLEGELKNYF